MTLLLLLCVWFGQSQASPAKSDTPANAQHQSAPSVPSPTLSENTRQTGNESRQDQNNYAHWSDPLVILQLLLFVAVLIQAGIYWKQLRTMRSTVALLNRQTDIAERSAKASETSAKAAKQSAKVAEEALRIGERPALGVTNVTLTTFNPNEVPIAKLEIKNTGRVPARCTSVHTTMNIRPEDDGPEPILPSLFRKQSRSTITVNADRHSFATTNRRLSVAEFEGVRDGRLWLYVYTMIRYSDGRGGDYFTEYYARFLPLLSQFEDCPTHNEAT